MPTLEGNPLGVALQSRHMGCPGRAAPAGQGDLARAARPVSQASPAWLPRRDGPPQGSLAGPPQAPDDPIGFYWISIGFNGFQGIWEGLHSRVGI